MACAFPVFVCRRYDSIFVQNDGNFNLRPESVQAFLQTPCPSVCVCAVKSSFVYPHRRLLKEVVLLSACWAQLSAGTSWSTTRGESSPRTEWAHTAVQFVSLQCTHLLFVRPCPCSCSLFLTPSYHSMWEWTPEMMLLPAAECCRCSLPAGLGTLHKSALFHTLECWRTSLQAAAAVGPGISQPCVDAAWPAEDACRHCSLTHSGNPSAFSTGCFHVSSHLCFPKWSGCKFPLLLCCWVGNKWLTIAWSLHFLCALP